MSVVYNRSHSIEIRIVDPNSIYGYYGSYNTWTDWHLIPASRPFVAQGQPNFNIVPLPGSSSFLDLTDIVPGGLTFSQRTGDWRFYIDHDFWNSWHEAVDTIVNAIHGKSVIVILLDEPSKQYVGRIAITDYESGENYSTITFTYTLQPQSQNTVNYPVDPYDGSWIVSGGSTSSGSNSGSGGGSSGQNQHSSDVTTGVQLFDVFNGSPNIYTYGNDEIEYVRASWELTVNIPSIASENKNLILDISNINASNSDIGTYCHIGYRTDNTSDTVDQINVVLPVTGESGTFQRVLQVNCNNVSTSTIYVSCYIRRSKYSELNGKFNYKLTISDFLE